MPPGFRASSKADVRTPLRPTTTGEGGGSNYAVIGRVAAGEFWARAVMQVSAVSRLVSESLDRIRQLPGVVRDVPQRSGWGNYGPLAPVPTVYLPAAQLPDQLVALMRTWFSPRWVVRASRRSPGFDLGMQRALASTDPLLAMNGFRDIDAVRADSLASQRLRAQLMGGLAGAAIDPSRVLRWE